MTGGSAQHPHPLQDPLTFCRARTGTAYIAGNGVVCRAGAGAEGGGEGGGERGGEVFHQMVM